MLRTAGVRVLDARDLPELSDLLARDPVTDVFVASRVQAAGLDSWRLGAEVWGYGDRGRLEAVCYSGANLVPCQAGPQALRAFAERARRQGRRCSSLVGPAESVLALWRALEPHWGPAREVRGDQPLLALAKAPSVEPDPRVRRVLPAQLDDLLPACIAMFTAEVGISPVQGDGGALYRARVQELIAQSRAFAVFDGRQVLFKADIGAATPQVCQVQGVWVDPAHRGAGLGSAGMAAVVAAAHATVAPVVTLYVNAFNTAARRSYAKVGFEQVGTFASVLF